MISAKGAWVSFSFSSLASKRFMRAFSQGMGEQVKPSP
jgi:hypothetical protein